jgi:type VI secretion system protein ImpH
MSAADRQNTPPLIDRLADTPEAFDFLSAFRLLRTHAASSPVDPATADAPAPDDAAWVANPSLAYPETELASVPREDGAPGQAPITVGMNFLGLHGPTGVLPAYVTQAVATLGRDYPLAQLLDFFNHQFAHDYARAADRAHVDQLVPDPGRPHHAEATSTPSVVVGDPTPFLLPSLAGWGQGTAALSGPRATRFDESVVRFYAAAWRSRPMPLTALQSVLRDLLQMPVRVLPFEPLWVDVEPQWRLRIGSLDRSGAGGYAAPSADAVPGKQAWVLGKRTRQIQDAVRIRIGPVRLRTFLRLLLPKATDPDAHRATRDHLLWRLAALVGAALGPSADFVFQPVLDRRDVQPWILGRTRRRAGRPLRAGGGVDPVPPRMARAVLGRTAFLLRRPVAADAPVYPFEEDFDRLKISSAAVRRSLARARRPD